jgi:leader peptidase (prepilin peptidase) / N-methyltransferase
MICKTEPLAPNETLRPRLPVMFAGSVAIAGLSLATLSGPAALASTLLGVLMIAGADIDARTFLLPDLVTGGTLLSGILAAPLLNPYDPAPTLGVAVLRAIGTAAVLLAVRWGYAKLRKRQGIGLGDVKLAAGIGAWLPTEGIPLCFALAASSALVLILLAHMRGRPVNATTKLPFGAFLCPALWLTFYISIWGS